MRLEKSKALVSQAGETALNEIVTLGLTSIPIIGNSLAAFYRDVNDRIKFDRIESFLADLRRDLTMTQEKMEQVDLELSLAKEEWAAFTEKLLNKVEREPSEEKRELFKQIFISTVYNTSYNYEKINIFLEVLDALHPIDIRFLHLLYKQNEAIVFRDITIEPYSVDELYGALQRIKNFGFVNVWFASLVIGASQDKNGENIVLNRYGKEFIEYVLK